MIKPQILEGYPEYLIRRIKQQEANNFRRKPSKAMQLIIEDLMLWQIGTLTVSFKGGTSDLHQAIAETAFEWMKYANILFDFGHDTEKNTYRTWVNDDRSHIRVGFEEQGYWSWIGTQSRDHELCKPGEITLNLEAFDSDKPANWRAVVLHEFGHALGFHHKHQSPISKCDFNWPKLYDILAHPPNNWSKEMVDYNLKKIAARSLSYSPHDSESIMRYSFPAWMFKSKEKSSCYIGEKMTLSDEDKRMARKAYPFKKANFEKQQQKRQKNLETALKKWTEGQLNENFLRDYLSYIQEDTSYRNFFPLFTDEKEYETKRCILIGAGHVGKDPNKLAKQAKLSNLLPTSYAYNLAAVLLDEVVKRYVKSATFSEAELRNCELVQDVIELVHKKTKS